MGNVNSNTEGMPNASQKHAICLIIAFGLQRNHLSFCCRKDIICFWDADFTYPQTSIFFFQNNILRVARGVGEVASISRSTNAALACPVGVATRHLLSSFMHIVHLTHPSIHPHQFLVSNISNLRTLPRVPVLSSRRAVVKGEPTRIIAQYFVDITFVANPPPIELVIINLLTRKKQQKPPIELVLLCECVFS
jgi:hypothetical protein